MMVTGGAYRVEGEREPRRALCGSFALRGTAARVEDLSPRAFPGRWNPRRAIAPELAPLPQVAADALESAGWWTRGSGEACRGGLVVANDSGPLLASIDFTREIHRTPDGPVRPAGFLHALPSTANSVLGLLFGLTDYQACTVTGALSGVQALRHALDLLALGRVERVLVVSLSVHEAAGAAASAGSAICGSGSALRLAVALCLESSVQGVDRTPAIDCGIAPGVSVSDEVSPGPVADFVRCVLREVPPEVRPLAALPLLLVAKYCEKCFSGAHPGTLTYHHQEPLTRGQVWITLRTNDDGRK